MAHIQGSIEWEVENICIYHAYISSQFNCEAMSIDKAAKEREARFEVALAEASDDHGSGMLEVMHSRFREQEYGVSQVIGTCQRFLDETTIVLLWMIAERFLGQIYLSFYTQVYHREPAKSDYKFDILKLRFLDLGVDLTTTHLYDDANECRVLNNAIKHGNVVSEALKHFPFFQNLSGPLRMIDLEMQRYVNGVHNFLGSTIELCDAKLCNSSGRGESSWDK